MKAAQTLSTANVQRLRHEIPEVSSEQLTPLLAVIQRHMQTPAHAAAVATAERPVEL